MIPLSVPVRHRGSVQSLQTTAFLLIGFGLMLMMRWQLAGSVMSPEFDNQLGATHGTIMIFLGADYERWLDEQSPSRP